MPALTLTINQVKEIHQKLSSGTIMKYPPGIVKSHGPDPAWPGIGCLVAGMDMWASSPERDRAGDAEVDASSWQGREHAPPGGSPFAGTHFDSQFLSHFLTNLYCDLDFSQDLTLQILFVFEPSQREKTEKSKASRAVQMQTRASMAVGTVEVGKRAGVIACKSFLSTAHIAL